MPPKKKTPCKISRQSFSVTPGALGVDMPGRQGMAAFTLDIE